MGIYALRDDNWSCYILHRIKVIGTGGKMWLGMIMHEELWEKYSENNGSKALAITV